MRDVAVRARIAVLALLVEDGVDVGFEEGFV